MHNCIVIGCNILATCISNYLVTAIARAMDEWERRKEEGEFKTDQEQEEDNIYAVSKDNEVQI